MAFISTKETARRVSLSERTVYNLVDSSEFPKPVRLTATRIAFVESEIEDWMLARVAARDQGEPDER